MAMTSVYIVECSVKIFAVCVYSILDYFGALYALYIYKKQDQFTGNVYTKSEGEVTMHIFFSILLTYSMADDE